MDEKKIEVVTLSTGESVNKFCMDRFNDLTTNTEVIWDVLDVVTQSYRLNVIKDDSGRIENIEFYIPRINEDLVLFAIKNFMKYQKLREEDGISMETALELRRVSLRKYMENINHD